MTTREKIIAWLPTDETTGWPEPGTTLELGPIFRLSMGYNAGEWGQIHLIGGPAPIVTAIFSPYNLIRVFGEDYAGLLADAIISLCVIKE